MSVLGVLNSDPIKLPLFLKNKKIEIKDKCNYCDCVLSYLFISSPESSSSDVDTEDDEDIDEYEL